MKLTAILKVGSAKRCIHTVTAPKFSENIYDSDTLLPRLVKTIYGQQNEDYTKVNDDLSFFGAQHQNLLRLSEDCEKHPPTLKNIDGWGGRINKISTCTAWKELHEIACREGLVAIRHDNLVMLREVHQAVKLLLFGGVSGMVSCPLAMTDGAATTLTNLLNSPDANGAPSFWKKTVSSTIAHLTTRNPYDFWTSGQWMTERKGGSDVTNATETKAVADPDGKLLLYGNKFYTSAIDCQTALTLARFNGHLSLFLVNLPQEYDGTIGVQKLKEKLGTRQLPTAELSLNGIPATLLAKRGIANIIPMLHITRLYNSIMAASYLRHVTSLARSFAETRSAFGLPINQLPLHKTSLARLECVTRGITLQSVDMAMLLSNKEVKSLSNVVRVLSAVVKIHTALVAVRNIRDGLECFGGAGYMEDTGLPGIFRDACVLPVWEGTTDVLSAETARALAKGDGLQDTVQYIRQLCTGRWVLGGYPSKNNDNDYTSLKSLESALDAYLSNILGLTQQDDKPGKARTIAECLGSAHTAACLLNFARSSRDSSDKAAATIWIKLCLTNPHVAQKEDIDAILQS